MTDKEAFSLQYDPEPIKEKLTLPQEIEARQNSEKTLSIQEVNSQPNRKEIVAPVTAITLETSTLI